MLKNILLCILITFSSALIFPKKGVITRGQLGLVEIIHQYIRYDEIHEAINVLNTMNWNTMGHQCYVCLSAIVNHLLKQKLTPNREGKGLIALPMCFSRVCNSYRAYDVIFIDCIKKTIGRIQIVSHLNTGLPNQTSYLEKLFQ